MILLLGEERQRWISRWFLLFAVNHLIAVGPNEFVQGRNNFSIRI